MLMLMLGIGFESCSSDDYVSRIHELLIDSKKLTFEASDDTGELSSTFTFRNEDISNYSASSDSTWCKAELDASKSTMTITVEENNSFEERQAIVTLLDTKDGVSSRALTVTQKQNNVVRVENDSTTYEVDTDGGQVVVRLESNVSYEVQIPSDIDWVTLPSETRSLQKSQVVLDVARNTTESSRSARITFINQESGAQANILIIQDFKAYLKIAQTSYTIDERGGDISIAIQTNISFDCYTVSDDTWIKKKGNRETINDNTVVQKISVAAFSEKSPSRSSTVTIENKSFGEEYSITITQTRDLYIEEASPIKILTGSSQNLTLYNANEEAVLWSSDDESVATVDENGKVTGVAVGSTLIKVSSSDGMHTDNVAVTVEKPADLSANITHVWQGSTTQYGDISVLTKLTCTFTNNSNYDLTVTKATLYCDDVVYRKNEYNESSGQWSIGKEMVFKADIDVEREDDIVVSDTTYTSDGTMVIKETTTPGKVKENNHKYKLIWEYSYSGESFSYSCEYPEENSNSESEKSSEARKKFARKGRRK